MLKAMKKTVGVASEPKRKKQYRLKLITVLTPYQFRELIKRTCDKNGANSEEVLTLLAFSFTPEETKVFEPERPDKMTSSYAADLLNGVHKSCTLTITGVEKIRYRVGDESVMARCEANLEAIFVHCPPLKDVIKFERVQIGAETGLVLASLASMSEDAEARATNAEAAADARAADAEASAGARETRTTLHITDVGDNIAGKVNNVGDQLAAHAEATTQQNFELYTELGDMKATLAELVKSARKQRILMEKFVQRPGSALQTTRSHGVQEYAASTPGATPMRTLSQELHSAARSRDFALSSLSTAATRAESPPPPVYDAGSSRDLAAAAPDAPTLLVEDADGVRGFAAATRAESPPPPVYDAGGSLDLAAAAPDPPTLPVEDAGGVRGVAAAMRAAASPPPVYDAGGSLDLAAAAPDPPPLLVSDAGVVRDDVAAATRAAPPPPLDARGARVPATPTRRAAAPLLSRADGKENKPAVPPSGTDLEIMAHARKHGGRRGRFMSPGPGGKTFDPKTPGQNPEHVSPPNDQDRAAVLEEWFEEKKGDSRL